jgi:molybdate transport system regulatory protein
MAKLSIRIDFDGGHRIGPGKIALLQAIERDGSISAAARNLGMSYRRAWRLVEETGTILGVAAVQSKVGGQAGGGAVLTAAGQHLVRQYLALDEAAGKVAQPILKSLQKKQK